MALFSLVAFAAILDSCENSEEPKPVTQQTCETNPKTYTLDVKPIIDSKCMVCHQPGGAYGSLPLTNYSQVKTATDSGKLMQTIRHEVGFPAMPQGGQKLSDVEISVLDCWISNGFPK